MRLGHRARVTLIGVMSILVALIAIAFAVGGSDTTTNDLARTSAVPAATPVPNGKVAISHGSATYGTVPMVAPEPALAAAPGVPTQADAPALDQESAVSGSSGGGSASGGGSGSAADSASAVSSGSSLAATRIVKTGNLQIRVTKANVKPVTDQLSRLATSEGGYVSSSNTSLDPKSPYGEVVVRVPVAHFQDTIDKASALGDHVISLTTSADDVTGRYVDLSARMHALERTRSTYLSILSRARTIGETLAVQQRVDDVQQQIDRLHGQIKLLANQSSYSTLTVDVVPAGVTTLAKPHHNDNGIGAAWHRSWSRFDRGVNAIVGAIGPIVFALLLLGVLGLIGLGGYRGVRRATGNTPAAP